MPWEGPESATPGAETRQQGIVKLCVPCLDSFTIQELADKITVQWGRIYIGYGSLDIKELKTIYNERLDMEETVGAYFDDRKHPDNKSPSDEPPSNSIVRVYRFPPDPRELRNIIRFGSLMPESAARPRKRPNGSLVQNSQSSLHAVASIKECGDELPNKNLSIPNKRQRTNEARLNEATRSVQPMLSQGYGKGGVHISSQTNGTQGSIHQVYDSQGSTAGKASNPYGTPTSLSLVSSQEPILCRQIDITSVPDSPTSRRVTSVDEHVGETINHDRERTKSESPEIELSVHDVLLPLVPRDPVKQTHTEIPPPRSTKWSYVPTSSTQPRSINLEEENAMEARDSGGQQSPQDTASSSHSPLVLQERSTQSAWGEAHHISNDQRRPSDSIFDMESDVEGIPERQRMHSAKRLRLALTATDRSPSPHVQRCLSKGPRDEHFLVSQTHKTGQDGVRNPLSELSVPNDNVNANMSVNGIGGTTLFDMKERQKIASPNGFNQLRTMPSHCDGSNSKRLQTEEGIAESKLLSEEERPSQVATFNSQASNLPVKNWSHLDVEHPLRQALSRGRRPNFTMPPNLKDDDDSQSSEGRPQTEEEERLQKQAEEQKKKERARERRAEQRTASREAKAKQDVDEEEGRRVIDQGPEKRKADEMSLADNKMAGEEGALVEQSEDAERETLAAGKEREMEAVDAQAVQEAEARKKRGLDKSRNDGNRIREEILREKALAEEAEKTRLRQDGAKQLILEELQKRKTPTSSSSKGAAAKTPSFATYRTRTVEQSAKRRADRQDSALGSKAPQNWAEALFQTNGSTLHSSEHIDTDKEEEQTLTKKVEAKSSDRDGEKLRASSAHRPSPTKSSSPGDPSRKSLTPALPSSTVTKSPSVRGNLKPSSPAASVSSVSSSHVDTPLRSALKHHQVPSALRRSVSFIHDQGDNPAHSFEVPLQSLAAKPYVSTALPIKTLVDLNNELALPPPDVSKVSKKVPVKILSDNEISKDNVAKREMVQQKLNVTRDKKLKGRAIDTPVSSRPDPEEENLHSSSQGDSGSVSSSGDDTGNGHAKAGPSSRKKPRAGPRQEPLARFNLRGTPIDPVIETIGSTNRVSPLHSLSSRTSPIPNLSSRHKSVSRSPAQVMSETISVSSSSSSGSQSEFESGSESEAESKSNTDSDSLNRGEAMKAKPPSSTQSSQPTAIKSDVTTKNAGVEIHHLKLGERSRQSSRQAMDSSTICEARNADDEAAGQQLQLESSQSVVPAQIAKTVSFSGNRIAPHDKLLNQGLNRDGRLPDGTRPAYFIHPKLSTLRKLQETTTLEEEASAPSASQSFAASSLVDCESSDSSSNESSSNNSDEDDVEVEVGIGPVGPSASPTGSKARSGGMPGLKGVMKRKSAETLETHVC